MSQLTRGLADYAAGDCGLGCLASESGRRGIYYGSVNALARYADGRQTDGRVGFNALTLQEVANVGTYLGISSQIVRSYPYESLMRDTQNDISFMALGYYQSLASKYDPSFRGNHYILVLLATDDTVYYHDPYWRLESDGAYKQMSKVTFERFWVNATLNDSPVKSGIRFY